MQIYIGRIILILSFIFFWGDLLRGHTIHLKNGQKISGTIKSQTELEVVIISNGKRIIISKNDIRSIEFEAEKKGGEKKEEKKRKEKSHIAEENRWSIAARSAILPGWGQFAAGRKYSAIVGISLFSGCMKAEREDLDPSGFIGFFLTQTVLDKNGIIPPCQGSCKIFIDK